MSSKAAAPARKRRKTKPVPVPALERAAVSEPGAEPVPAVPVPAAEPTPAPVACAEPASAPGPTVVQLDGGLQIKDVEDAHRRLVAAFAGGGAVAIDVSRISMVDTAGVQLLLSLSAEAARRGVALDMRGESPVLTKALTALGLAGACRASVP